ncbi:MAG: hypothetical protein AAB069_03770, partial [Planctomycetota bacterium]
GVGIITLVFVHGYSVTDMKSYGQLPEALQAVAEKTTPDVELDIKHIYLGRYISFHDEVTMDDIARAFDKARLDAVGDQPFSCITHSTGGPAIRTWMELYYGAGNWGKSPLRHLIMLAPANHGSALAQLGKGRLSRMVTWFQGVEPGQKVLDWLELNSEGQWLLNESWLSYNPAQSNFFPFVITGQYIDAKLYDHLNSYTGEKGSDGVMRVCGTNMNYQFIRLRQSNTIIDAKEGVCSLEIVKETSKIAPLTPIAIIPGASHTGEKMGIMFSVTIANAFGKPVVKNILDCLQINDAARYTAIYDSMERQSKETQDNDDKTKDKYSMVFFRLHDDRGNTINDFDILLLGSKDYDPDKLESGFFVDRQRNRVSANHLTYYVDHNKMMCIKDGVIGFRIIARPSEGFSYYKPAEFRSDGIPLDDLLKPNQTLYVDIELKRHVDQNVFRLLKRDDIKPIGKEKSDFSGIKPAGTEAP